MMRDLFIARTNGGMWVHTLLAFAVVASVGIALSLMLFLKVRAINNRTIETSTVMPGAREVDKEHIRDVINAFSARVATFEVRLRNGVSIPDPY